MGAGRGGLVFGRGEECGSDAVPAGVGVDEEVFEFGAPEYGCLVGVGLEVDERVSDRFVSLPGDQIPGAGFGLKVKPWQVFVGRREGEAGQRICDRVEFLTADRSDVDRAGDSGSVMAFEIAQLAALRPA